MKRTPLTVAAILIMLARAATGQTPGTGAISGSVYDSAGRVVAGADVAAVEQTTQARRSAVTSAEGGFRIPLLMPGAWTVTVSAKGFAASQPMSVAVTVSAVSSIRVERT